MKCANCDYLLFNLTQPVCPECGQSFVTEQYIFTHGEVSFHCPHCDQAYYGNDERGLPTPRAFECVKCHQHIELQQMRVVPQVEGACGYIGGRGSPWDRRKELGVVRAWWDTFKMILTEPSRFFRDHTGRSFSEAYLFAVISTYAGVIPLYALQVGIQMLFMNVQGMGMPISVFLLMIVGFALIGPLVYPIFSAINAAFIQVGLYFLVPHRKPWDATYRCVLYSMAPNALQAVPFCGGYVAPIWSIVVMVIGVREVHQTNTFRAVLAVFWPLFAMLALLVLALVVLAVAAI